MIITEKWLQEKSACNEGIEYAKNAGELDGIEMLKKLIADDKLDWANWLIVRIMDYKQYVSYAIFAAEQVIGNFEKEFPTDNRPRLAIEAAKKCLENPNVKNRKAAEWAARSAWSAARLADSTARSAFSAARSARSAEWSTVRSAAWSAALLKNLNYGLNLLEGK